MLHDVVGQHIMDVVPHARPVAGGWRDAPPAPEVQTTVHDRFGRGLEDQPFVLTPPGLPEPPLAEGHRPGPDRHGLVHVQIAEIVEPHENRNLARVFSLALPVERQDSDHAVIGHDAVPFVEHGQVVGRPRRRRGIVRIISVTGRPFAGVGPREAVRAWAFGPRDESVAPGRGTYPRRRRP